MGYEVSFISKAVVHNEEEFTKLKAEKLNPEAEYSPKRYRIVALDWKLLEGVKEYLEAQAEDANREDWDGNDFKQYAEDESVSDLLKELFSVEKTPNTYRVTVEFTVEAEDENEAENEINQSINGYIDYEVMSIDED